MFVEDRIMIFFNKEQKKEGQWIDVVEESRASNVHLHDSRDPEKMLSNSLNIVSLFSH